MGRNKRIPYTARQMCSYGEHAIRCQMEIIGRGLNSFSWTHTHYCGRRLPTDSLSSESDCRWADLRKEKLDAVIVESEIKILNKGFPVR